MSDEATTTENPDQGLDTERLLGIIDQTAPNHSAAARRHVMRLAKAENWDFARAASEVPGIISEFGEGAAPKAKGRASDGRFAQAPPFIPQAPKPPDTGPARAAGTNWADMDFNSIPQSAVDMMTPADAAELWKRHKERVQSQVRLPRRAETNKRLQERSIRETLADILKQMSLK